MQDKGIGTMLTILLADEARGSSASSVLSDGESRTAGPGIYQVSHRFGCGYPPRLAPRTCTGRGKEETMAATATATIDATFPANADAPRAARSLVTQLGSTVDEQLAIDLRLLLS